MTDEKLKILKKMKIELINKDTKTYVKDTKRKLIYRMDNVWYAVIAPQPNTVNQMNQNVNQPIKHATKSDRKQELKGVNTVYNETIQNIPKSKPEKPKSKPEKPESEPEKPKSKPDKPKSKPDKPKSKQDKPKSKRNESTNNNKSMKNLYIGGSEHDYDDDNDKILTQSLEYIESREQIRKYLRQVYLDAITYENNITYENKIYIKTLTNTKYPEQFLNNVHRESDHRVSALPAQSAVSVMGGGNDENYKLKISTEIRHDFQSVLDPEIYKKIIKTFSINPLSEDNYVRTVIKNILKDDSFCFDKFKMKNVNKPESISHKLIHTIGREQFKDLRTVYSPDMHLDHKVVNEFLSDGTIDFNKKYSLPRIMDPITKDKKCDHNELLFVFQLENDESRFEKDGTINAPKDLEQMTKITQSFFEKIGYNANFEFSKIEYKQGQINFTIQEKGYPNNTVSIKQGYFSIAKVVEIINMLNQKKRNNEGEIKYIEELNDLKKLSSWISPVVQGSSVDNKLKDSILAILFKSLGDHLQIYIAKEAVNDLKKCFFITTKDRIAIATAIEIHTPCIFQSKLISKSLFINNEVDDEKDKSPEESKVENTVMFIGDLNSKTDFDKNEIEFIIKVSNKARLRNTLYNDIVGESDIFPQEDINNESMKEFIKDNYIKSVSEYMTLLNMLSYVVYSSVSTNEKEELFRFSKEEINKIRNIEFATLNSNQLQEPINNPEQEIEKVDSSTLIKICRFILQLKKKKFINDNGVQKIIKRLNVLSSDLQKSFNEFEKYYFKYKEKVNKLKLEEDNYGIYKYQIYENRKILKNLKEYIQYETYLDGLYDVLEPFYDLMKLFGGSLNIVV
jgi:hypothetical protein